MANTFAVGAFFVAVISGGLALSTFAPNSFDSNFVGAAAASFAYVSATTTVCDPDVVASAATFCTPGNRQFSLHLSMIRPWGCFDLFHTGRCANILHPRPRLRRKKITGDDAPNQAVGEHAAATFMNFGERQVFRSRSLSFHRVPGP